MYDLQTSRVGRQTVAPSAGIIIATSSSICGGLCMILVVSYDTLDGPSQSDISKGDDAPLIAQQQASRGLRLAAAGAQTAAGRLLSVFVLSLLLSVVTAAAAMVSRYLILFWRKKGKGL